MRFKAAIVGVVLALLTLAAPVFPQSKAFRQKVYNASLQLYVVEHEVQKDGTVKAYNNPECTTDNFEKTPTGYHLLTAAHCVVTEHESILSYDMVAPDGTLFVSYGDPGTKRALIPATVLMVGNYHDGWDIAILDIETSADIPVVPLGDDTKLDMGDKLVSVSAPVGGEIKYWFEGYVSATRHQVNPSIGAEIRDWQRTIFVDMPGYPGSSGSGVISVDQEALVGIFISEVRGQEPYYDRMATAIVPASAVREFILNQKLHLALEPKK